MIVWLYGVLALVSLANWLLLRRPRAQTSGPSFVVLIPARNEADKIGGLVSSLVSQGLTVHVFDDESDDGTGDIAAQAGAKVLRPAEPLPAGWTGKNRACHALGHDALKTTTAEWLLFLDADVVVGADFGDAVRGALPATVPAPPPGRRHLPWARRDVGVVTAMPQILPGSRLEPVCLAWVGALILSTSPVGPCSRARRGDAIFMNGQFHAWHRSIYAALEPNEAVRGRILEDVQMARLCARNGVFVETISLAHTLRVRMYETPGQAIDGMSKNSFEIGGSIPATIFLALFMLVWAWGWTLNPAAFLLLALNGWFVARAVRASGWLALAMPLVLTVGAFVFLRSMVWHQTGRIQWKGRTYGPPK